MWLEHRHYRNNFLLESCDKKYAFRVFMRYSDDFIEDFSIGLVWTNPTGYINVTKHIILLRCQGPHDNKEPLGSDIHHSFHTHEISIDDINEYRYTKPSSKGIDKNFSSFQSAIWHFVNRCGIVNPSEYIDFASASQLSLEDLTIGGETNG